MGVFSFMETFFFISLGITFVMIIMLVYHFKQRMNFLEQKHDTMFEIVNNIVKQLKKKHKPKESTFDNQVVEVSMDIVIFGFHLKKRAKDSNFLMRLKVVQFQESSLRQLKKA
jgi:hypothetical protein